jgi:hypothetical protein
LKHVRGVVPLVVGEEGPALDIGSCVHLILACHYARLLPDDRYPGYRANCPQPQVLLEALKTAGLPLTVAVEVERLYDGYAEHYANEALTPVAVEMPVGVVGVHTSRYDLVSYVEDGLHDGLWINEHKTASPQSDLDEFRFDGEVLGEMLSAELTDLEAIFGMNVQGVCVNALVKPDKRSKSSLPRYQRLWLTFPPSLIAEYRKDRLWWNRLRITCMETGVWPKSMQGCRSRYSKCRFWDHCRLQDEGQLKEGEG